MGKTIVVIGGDAAGMSAAAKIKRDAPEMDVIVFEKGEYISYSACGMPYWIGGVVDLERKLIVMTPKIARGRRNIDVRIGHEVIAIDPARRHVTVKNLDTQQTFQQGYTQLLIATGARATRPPLPGIDLPGIFTLRSLQDAERIYQYLAEHAPKKAVVIGGGYIGLEMAEALRHRNLDVAVVEMMAQILPNFDADMVGDVTEHLGAHQVQLLAGTAVQAIQSTDSGLRLELDGDAAPLDTELVILSTGVKPVTELAELAGIRIGDTGAIWTDPHMRTSAEHIYAAGDCVEHYHIVLEKNAWVPLATSASKGGRIVADNITGQKATFPGILGTAVVKVFDYTLSLTGVTERQAKQSGKWGEDGAYVGSTTITENDKVGYWPGVEPLKVKLVYDKRDGRLLGGQLSGKAGVNKRIDIIATAISAKMTVGDIGLLDLSYAPPYSPTHDPIQVCANVALRNVESDHRV